MSKSGSELNYFFIYLHPECKIIITCIQPKAIEKFKKNN